MSNKPTQTVYTIRFYPGQDGKEHNHSLEIGSAWTHKKDGNGLDVQLVAVPVNGRVALRTNAVKPKKAAVSPTAD